MSVYLLVCKIESNKRLRHTRFPFVLTLEHVGSLSKPNTIMILGILTPVSAKITKHRCYVSTVRALEVGRIARSE